MNEQDLLQKLYDMSDDEFLTFLEESTFKDKINMCHKLLDEAKECMRIIADACNGELA